MAYAELSASDRAEFVVDRQGRRIVNAHSRGGGRACQLSPLVARLSNGCTVEFTYHAPKINAAGVHLPARNGSGHPDAVAMRFSNGLVLPMSMKNEYHYLLYWLLFQEQPDLLEYARSFDGARDFFDKERGRHYLYSETPFEVDPLARCCQGRTIAWCINQRPLHPQMIELAQWFRQRFPL